VKMTYRKAGVDIEKGDRAIKKIKKMVHLTYNRQVLTELGLFGGMYSFNRDTYRQPVLVSSVDGVGTKLKVAILMDKHDTIGEDLVNHCVNDIAVGGAQPLFFLDYFATGRLETEIFYDVIKGFVRGCKNNHCALIGGETAEMPDLYRQGEYDLSGTIVGVVEKNDIINGKKIKRGDVLVGVNSSGLHTNGYSLARRVLFKKLKADSYIPELGRTLGAELLQVHLSYLRLIQSVRKKIQVKGIAHITGGGIIGNTRRLLQAGLSLQVNWQGWSWPPLFQMIKRLGQVPETDMRSTFNLGIGLVFIIRAVDTDAVCRQIKANGFEYYLLGEVI
jgi:phosphoribosylformylglycinamidine cyclo-ligase